MLAISDPALIKIVQDIDKAISVMHEVGKWLQDSGKNPSKWWQPQNLNQEFLLQYAKPQEFFAVLVDKKPAAAAILQLNQNAQDWKNVDKNKSQPALYIHWLCVKRQFSNQGLPKLIIDFAKQLAKNNNVNLLRVDTNAEEQKLRDLYEELGFNLVSIEQEDYRKTAFYQQSL